MRVPRQIAEFNRRVTNPAARAITPWVVSKAEAAALVVPRSRWLGLSHWEI